jgi:PAS domain S-box-containing protein
MSSNSIQGGLSIIEMVMDEQGVPSQWQMPGTTLVSAGAGTAERIAELVPALEKWWFQSLRNIEPGDDHNILSTRVLVSNHWVDVYAFRLTGSNDRQLGLLFNDITEQMEASQALRASDERWQIIFNNSGVGLALNDGAGKFVMTNAVYQRMLGYSAAELRAMTWVDVTHEDDRPMNERMGTELWSGSSSHIQYEKRYRRKDGVVIWVRNTVSLAPGTEDVPRFALAIVEDITERKRAEADLHALLQTLEQRVAERTSQLTIANAELQTQIEQRERAQDDLRRSELYMAEAERLCHFGSSVWHAKTDELFWSDETYRMFGFEPRSFQPSQELFIELVHADDRAAFKETIEAAIRNAHGYELEFRAVRQDGAIRAMQSIGEPACDNSGAVIELVGAVMDITERKEVHESMQSQMAELKRVEEQRSYLLRQIVSAQESERRRISREVHDHLGQQLTGLRMNLALLRRRLEGAKLASELDPLEDAVRHLDADLDFLARELRPAVLGDLGLPQAVANFVDSWSEHFGVPADFEASGIDQNRLPGELETVLYRVTQEALNNVAKHAEASNVAVLLHRNTSYVSLIIEDNGLGFDYNQHLVKGEKGLGLMGLRERVELTGGTLEIESRVGHGTTIAVRIPV